MTRGDDVDALEARLLRALQADEGPDLDAAWRAGVMRSVRARASLDDAQANVAATGGIVRRALLTAATVALIVGAVVGERVTALEPSAELSGLIANDFQGLLHLVWVL
ncbi:MAG: hypothetical protein HZA52_21700 [Planctomycetes bacterium]|nr:hypothetical protein [Planctomycetota bacterium]